MANVTVFCGARGEHDQAMHDAAYWLGQSLAQANHTLIYGGANVGLMGVIANAVLDHGGIVEGVITTHLAQYIHQNREIVHAGLSNLIIVDSLAERKQAMIDQADAFIVLPGGLGTLDELFEVLTLIQLGIIHKPVIIVSIHDYFRPLTTLLLTMEQYGFVNRREIAIVTVTTIPEALDCLATVLHPRKEIVL